MNMLLRLYPGDAWALLIANVLVQVTVVILAALFLARLGCRWNAAWRHRVYLVALACVLASPAWSCVMQATGAALVIVRTPIPAPPPAEHAGTPTIHIPGSRFIEKPAGMQIAGSRVPSAAKDLGHSLRPEARPSPSFPAALRALGGLASAIWLLGAALLFARWCHGLHRTALLRRAAQPLDSGVVAELLRQVRQALGTDRLPPVATSAGVDRPIMVGLARPLVILPESLLSVLNEAELTDVLVHECAHAVCRHHVIGFLQRMAGMLFWPHPLVHHLNRELARAREEVCDNYVLRRSDAPRYARTLLELSHLLVDPLPRPMALGLFHCRWRLEDRIADLLDRRRKTMIRVNRWTAAALAAAFLFLALAIAGIAVVQAEPAAGDIAAQAAAPSGALDQSGPSTSNAGTVLQKPIEGRNFVIVPFTTELQRACSWNYGEARLLVLINGKALFKEADTVLDTAALDYAALSKALEPFAPYGRTKGIIAEVLCPPFPAKARYISASSAFLGFLDSHGWHTDTDDKGNVAMVHYRSERDWASTVADLSKPATDEETRLESGLGDGLVKVYPICTPLSRFFYGGAGENCVVRNMKPLDRLTSGEIQALSERAKTYLTKLELKQPPRPRLLIRYSDDSLHTASAAAKANRAAGQWQRETQTWCKARGGAICGVTMWEAGRPVKQAGDGKRPPSPPGLIKKL